MTDPVNKLIDDMDKARFDGASGMLRIVLSAIQRGEVVELKDIIYCSPIENRCIKKGQEIVLKPEFQKFLEEKS